MTTRSARLAGPVVVPESTDVVLYTCPAGVTALVKWVTINNASAALQADVIMGINQTLGPGRIFRHREPTLSSSQHDVWWVLEPGDSLQVRISNADPGTAQATISVHGALLQGTAE